MRASNYCTNLSHVQMFQSNVLGRAVYILVHIHVVHIGAYTRGAYWCIYTWQPCASSGVFSHDSVKIQKTNNNKKYLFTYQIYISGNLRGFYKCSLPLIEVSNTINNVIAYIK